MLSIRLTEADVLSGLVHSLWAAGVPCRVSLDVETVAGVITGRNNAAENPTAELYVRHLRTLYRKQQRRLARVNYRTIAKLWGREARSAERGSAEEGTRHVFRVQRIPINE